MSQDLKQLQLLSIFHYILGGLFAVLSFAGLLRFIAHWTLISDRVGPMPHHYGYFGPLMMATPIFYILMGCVLAVGLILAGNYLARQIHYIYCLVVAAISCLFIPLGTILGILTMIVLMRDSVRVIFEQHRQAH